MGPGTRTRLVAVRLPLDPGPALDPFEVAGATGIVFQSADRIMVGLGAALTLTLPHGLESPADIDQVTEQLAVVSCGDHYDPTTSGVVAFGTLPFDRMAQATLVVPEILYVVEATGVSWVTVVATASDDLPATSDGLRAWLRDEARRRAAEQPTTVRADPVVLPRSTAPAGPTITSRLSDASFEAMVADVVEAIGTGDVAKVVVARQVDVRMDAAIDVEALLRRWHQLEPTCSVFSMPTPSGQLVGASPELLVERSARHVRSRPLAGTTDLANESNGVLPRELLTSAKDSAEHRMVVEAIGDALIPLCSELEVPDHPDLVHLHNLTHLGTSVTGVLAQRPDGGVPTALELVATLHPTPAVGGVPRQEALTLISRLEPEPRGHYAGPVGYVDGSGDGSWMLGIRAVTIDGPDARLVAGVGVVEGSKPRTERVETVLKLTAVFDALAPGTPFSTTGHLSPAEAAG